MQVVDSLDDVSIRCVKGSDGCSDRGSVYVREDKFFQEYPHCATLQHIDEIDYLCSDDTWYHTSLEGTIIRVFYVEGSWYTSTTRKLNAYHSMWVNKVDNVAFRINEDLHLGYSFNDPRISVRYGSSYGRRFELAILSRCDGKIRNILEWYERMLDKSNKYVFMLLRNEDDRIVCDLSPNGDNYETKVRLLLVFDASNNAIMNETIAGVETHPMKRLCTVEDLADAKILFRKENDYRRVQGLHIFVNEANAKKSYKIYLPTYTTFSLVRNNERDLVARYFQLRIINEEDAVWIKETFFKLFPRMNCQSVIIEAGLNVISTVVHREMSQRNAVRLQRNLHGFDVPKTLIKYNVVASEDAKQQRPRESSACTAEMYERVNGQMYLSLTKDFFENLETGMMSDLSNVGNVGKLLTAMVSPETLYDLVKEFYGCYQIRNVSQSNNSQMQTSRHQWQPHFKNSLPVNNDAGHNLEMTNSIRFDYEHGTVAGANCYYRGRNNVLRRLENFSHNNPHARYRPPRF